MPISPQNRLFILKNPPFSGQNAGFQGLLRLIANILTPNPPIFCAFSAKHPSKHAKKPADQ